MLRTIIVPLLLALLACDRPETVTAELATPPPSGAPAVAPAAPAAIV